VSETENEGSAARPRSLRWMVMLWEGANTTALEEDRKEEVLAVFRELARDSKGWEVREYVPWEPRWR
jgi:ABC-type histidine transport system ATPase subunit